MREINTARSIYFDIDDKCASQYSSDNPYSRDFTDCKISLVCDVNVSQSIDCDTTGIGKRRVYARTIGKTDGACGACERRDNTLGVNLTDQVIARIRDVNITRTIHRDIAGEFKQSARTWPIG